MYKSPVEVVYGAMHRDVQNGILKVVQSYDVKVDEEELRKALEYDRGQYEKGYKDGFREGAKKAEEAIVKMLRNAFDWEEEMGSE